MQASQVDAARATIRPTGSQPTLHVEGVSKTFTSHRGVTPVLKNLNLQVNDGELVTIVGPSGCGKSTLLNILAGLLPTTEGVLKVNGKPITGPDDSIGYATQRDTLLPWRTLGQNVEFVQEIRGVKKAERQEMAARLCQSVGLGDFMDHYPHEMSGGMRQRAMIIRCLAYQPDILLLDEPFGALDAQTRGQLQNLLLDLFNETRKTMVFITHDLVEAVALADRIVVLSNRPGTIHAIHEVNIPRPRDVFSIHDDPEFRRLHALLTYQILGDPQGTRPGTPAAARIVSNDHTPQIVQDPVLVDENASPATGGAAQHARDEPRPALEVTRPVAETTPEIRSLLGNSAVIPPIEADQSQAADRQEFDWRDRLRRGPRRLLTHVVFLAAILGSWELVSGGLIDEFWISSPTSVFAALYKWIESGELLHNLSITLYEVLWGVALGTAVGTSLALVLSEVPRARGFLESYVTAAYGIPKSALAPLFILWFGIDLMPKVIMAAAMVFFLMFFNTSAGLKAVDRDYINLAKIAGASRLQTWRKIKVPSILPYWFAGLKLSVPMGLIGAIVAEFISSDVGIGYLILRASNYFDTASIFAAVLVLAVCVAVINFVIVQVEARLLRWRPKV